MSDPQTAAALCRDVIQQASDAGAEGCEVLVTRTCTRTATWQTAAVTGAVALGPRELTALHIRAICDGGRAGTAKASSSGALNVESVVASALRAARAADPGPSAGTASRFDVTTMGLGIHDRRNQMLTDEDRTTVIENNVRACGNVVGARPVLFRYVETVEDRAFRSSRGVELSESATHYALNGTVALEADESIVLEDWVASRHFADVASIPLGVDVGRRVSRYVDPIPMPEGALPAVLEPSLVAQLMGAVTPAFDRSRIDRGQSFVTGELGQPLGSSLLHMIDDAARSGGLATRGFDARGVPPVSMPLIREGKAGAFYTSVDQAVALDSRPSGHEHPDGTAWTGNLLLRSGNRSRNMMFPELGEFIMLDRTVGDGLQVDLVKGTLSLRAHTFLSEGGQVKGYLGAQTFETTWLDLWGGIREIGSDQQRFGAVDAATWIVDGLPPSR